MTQGSSSGAPSCTGHLEITSSLGRPHPGTHKWWQIRWPSDPGCSPEPAPAQGDSSQRTTRAYSSGWCWWLRAWKIQGDWRERGSFCLPELMWPDSTNPLSGGALDGGEEFWPHCTRRLRPWVRCPPAGEQPMFTFLFIWLAFLSISMIHLCHTLQTFLLLNSGIPCIEHFHYPLICQWPLAAHHGEQCRTKHGRAGVFCILTGGNQLGCAPCPLNILESAWQSLISFWFSSKGVELTQLNTFC